ncbi:MAG: Gfo/Idh/MocA family oxidoreductase [Propionibacteriaceae bacterium]|nr:Gfo/Idh/MocA family oxidoreductase [Propionibacteriaceae bacterium]
MAECDHRRLAHLDRRFGKVTAVTETRYAIVGLGYGATRCALLRDTPGSRLVAVVDADPSRAASVGDVYDVPAYTQLEDALRDDDIDVVAIYVPTGLHLPLAQQVIRAGKHLLVTKPMETTLSRADSITDAARAAGVEVFSEHYLRYYPDNLRARRAIGAGLLGAMVLGEFAFKCYRPEAYYHSDGAWRQTVELNGGGIVMNQAIHAIDQLTWLMGRPTSVTAQVATFGMDLPVENTAVAMMTMESGAIATLATTSTYRTTSGDDDMYGGGYTTRAEVNGVLGSLSLIDNQVVMERLTAGPLPELGDAAVNIFADVSAALADPGYASESLVRGDQARLPLEVATAIYQSSRTGATVHLADTPLTRVAG